MTLTEARSILEQYQPREQKVRDAIQMVVYILPKAPDKPRAEIRLAEIIKAIGFNPFDGRKLRKTAVWRHCIMYRMYLEDFSQKEITQATGLNHSTVTIALQNIKDMLRYKDELTHKTWAELLEKLGRK